MEAMIERIAAFALLGLASGLVSGLFGIGGADRRACRPLAQRGVAAPGLYRAAVRDRRRSHSQAGELDWDSVKWSQHERRTRSAPSPACGGGLGRGDLKRPITLRAPSLSLQPKSDVSDFGQ